MIESGDLHILQQLMEAKAELIAERAAQKAVDKSEERNQKIVQAHQEACPGKRLATLSGRVFWLLIASVVTSVVTILAAIVKAAQ